MRAPANANALLISKVNFLKKLIGYTISLFLLFVVVPSYSICYLSSDQCANESAEGVDRNGESVEIYAATTLRRRIVSSRRRIAGRIDEFAYDDLQRGPHSDVATRDRLSLTSIGAFMTPVWYPNCVAEPETIDTAVPMRRIVAFRLVVEFRCESKLLRKQAAMAA